MALLQLSDDDTVDLDLAVKAMENATADLQRLGSDQQSALQGQRRAAAESDPRMAALLHSFAEADGLRQASPS